MQTVISLDIGSTGTKACLINQTGKILAATYQRYNTYTDGRNVEQAPLDWWQAVCTGINELTKDQDLKNLEAIVLSGQMQNLILVEPEYPRTILYSDTRAEAEAILVDKILSTKNLNEITGNLQDASSLLAKLLWIKKNWPDAYRQSNGLLFGAHDYIAWKMTGAKIVDFTTASTTGLFCLNRNSWADQFFDELDLRQDWLPQLTSAGEIVGYLSDPAAQACGLPAGLPVIEGAGDAATATMGSGAGEPGQIYVYLGTSGWLAGTVSGEPVDPQTGIFNLRHPNPDYLIQIGPMITAAGNFEWLKRVFGELETKAVGKPEDQAYELINQIASIAPAGSHGLLYLPYLAGERAPFRDANARGSFIGLNFSTERGDIYRSVLEGVAFSMRSIYQAMILENHTPGRITLTGGGANSTLWAQIFADIFNCKVCILQDPANVGTRGAAMIAGRTLQWFHEANQIEQFYPVDKSFSPHPENAAVYDQIFPIFCQAYPGLKPVFDKMASAGLHSR